MNTYISVLLSVVSFVSVVTPVFAASPDGAGPWADSVVSSSQANTKGGQPVNVVNATRSNPQSAVGVAENTDADDTFFSLGFGGSIVLQFQNGVRDGIIAAESTHPNYPIEKARIEVSADGVHWTTAGTVSQDGQVAMPDNVSCVNYVKVTDVSNPSDFTEDTADGYDVDGIQAINAESCDGGNTGGETTPTPTPAEEVGPTPTSQPSTGSSGSSNSGSSNDSKPKECTSSKPATPTLTSVVRVNGSTATITWTSVNPVTTYAISYGISPGNYQFGVPSTGNVTSFTIGGLNANATYYFAVRGINDCMPGDSSNERGTNGEVLAGGIGGGDILGTSTDVLAATGSVKETIAIVASFIAAGISYGIYKFRTAHVS